MISRVAAASPMLRIDPYSGLVAGPSAQRMATGSREIPMTVITVPVTTGGKNRSSLVKNGEIRKAMAPATMRAPKIARSPASPPSGAPMATMVETAANDVPCTIGSRAPIFQTPRVWSSVASPEMNRPALIR